MMGRDLEVEVRSEENEQANRNGSFALYWKYVLRPLACRRIHYFLTIV